LKERNQVFSTETRFPEQGHQRAFWYITIVLRNDGAATPGRVVVDEVAPRRVIQDKAMLF